MPHFRLLLGPLGFQTTLAQSSANPQKIHEPSECMEDAINDEFCWALPAACFMSACGGCKDVASCPWCELLDRFLSPISSILWGRSLYTSSDHKQEHENEQGHPPNESVFPGAKTSARSFRLVPVLCFSGATSAPPTYCLWC